MHYQKKKKIPLQSHWISVLLCLPDSDGKNKDLNIAVSVLKVDNPESQSQSEERRKKPVTKPVTLKKGKTANSLMTQC